MTVRIFARSAAITAALIAPIASADSTTKSVDKTTTTKPAKVKLTDAELHVLAHYHHLDQSEIDMGKMAQMSGASQAVKTYGSRLITDHGKSDKDLVAFAKHNGVMVIPAELPTNDTEKQEMKDDKNAMIKLHTLKGANFDRAFIKMMIEGHEKELAKIDTNLGMADNIELQTLLKDTKPLLQNHADTARELQKSNTQVSINPPAAK